MYKLNFKTATARDVLRRSLICHPSLFADALRKQRDDANIYAAQCEERGDKITARAARSRSNHCQNAINRIIEDKTDAANTIALLGTGPLVVAFNEACTLQLIPRYIRGAIITKE